jgi:hypothetical protein
MLKVPGTDRLMLKYDQLVSIFAFSLNLRRYITALAAVNEMQSDLELLMESADYAGWGLMPSL